MSGIAAGLTFLLTGLLEYVWGTREGRFPIIPKLWKIWKLNSSKTNYTQGLKHQLFTASWATQAANDGTKKGPGFTPPSEELVLKINKQINTLTHTHTHTESLYICTFYIEHSSNT